MIDYLQYAADTPARPRKLVVARDGLEIRLVADSWTNRMSHAYPAPAKLNLFLHVVGRRADGYHLLQSVFRLIDRADTVHLELRDDGRVVRERDLPGVAEDDDLTVRAARLLQTYAPEGAGVNIRLEKNPADGRWAGWRQLGCRHRAAGAESPVADQPVA